MGIYKINLGQWKVNNKMYTQQIFENVNLFTLKTYVANKAKVEKKQDKVNLII